MIGCISYDLKTRTGAIPGKSVCKNELVECLKKNLGAENFLDGFKNRNFTILVDKHIKERSIPNEKEPST
jgi:hypothetical protein